MLLKTLIKNINKIIITQSSHYEAKTQHHMLHQKHTHRDKMEVRGSRKLYKQTKKKHKTKNSQKSTQNPIVVFEDTTSR